ncbi:A-kinase anchor protein 17A [Ditylenchus destructor]|nr:A-kinase anchor protein 17A [Ditylenchus destructor]
MSDELIPFFTYRDLYLKQMNKINIVVNLPKLRQLGQSVSNWEIRERLKKMLNNIELLEFKVQDSNLEQVTFELVINSAADCRYIIKQLDGVSFRAVGFTEPLIVSATMGKMEFPTRVDWDTYFAENSAMDERNAGERPDTVYIGGLPFEWFKSPIHKSYEETFEQIFSDYGQVLCVDIPQCDPLRKQMDDEISGIKLSSWSFGQVLVQKTPGSLRETKIKVDFDKTAHLSYRKVKQREVKRAYLDYENDKKPPSIQEVTSSNAEKEDTPKSEELAKQLIRAEKRRKNAQKAAQKKYEQLLRKKLKAKLTQRLHSTQKERETGAKALLQYIATLHRARLKKDKLSSMGASELASEYVKERGLPDEESMKEKLLRRQELKLRSRIAERMLKNEPQRDERK